MTTTITILVDGDNATSLDNFLADNIDSPLDDADVNAIRDLPVGGVHVLGGGAAAEFRIERV